MKEFIRRAVIAAVIGGLAYWLGAPPVVIVIALWPLYLPPMVRAYRSYVERRDAQDA